MIIQIIHEQLASRLIAPLVLLRISRMTQRFKRFFHHLEMNFTFKHRDSSKATEKVAGGHPLNSCKCCQVKERKDTSFKNDSRNSVRG